jgi:hypothetical protein
MNDYIDDDKQAPETGRRRGFIDLRNNLNAASTAKAAKNLHILTASVEGANIDRIGGRRRESAEMAKSASALRDAADRLNKQRR